MSRLAGSTTYATDGVDDGKRATTAAMGAGGVAAAAKATAAATTITETLTTKSVQRAREDNDTTKRTTTLAGEREWERRTCACAYVCVCATNWVRENVGAQIGFVLSCDACGGV